MSAVKIASDQHSFLHRHYPDDCCLCRTEVELAAWRQAALERETAQALLREALVVLRKVEYIKNIPPKPLEGWCPVCEAGARFDGEGRKVSGAHRIGCELWLVLARGEKG